MDFECLFLCNLMKVYMTFERFLVATFDPFFDRSEPFFTLSGAIYGHFGTIFGPK